MLDKDRERRVSHPRFEAMYLIRQIRRRSYPVITRLFNKQDHTSTLYGVRHVTKRMADDPAYGAEIKALHDRLASEVYREGLVASEAVGAFLASLYSHFYTSDGWPKKTLTIRGWNEPRY
jgi:hypothetical protein